MRAVVDVVDRNGARGFEQEALSGSIFVCVVVDDCAERYLALKESRLGPVAKRTQKASMGTRRTVKIVHL